MKFSKILFAVCLVLLSIFLVSNNVFSDTHIPGGEVSGTWTIDGSPYIVEGDVTIPIDSTLIIEPGVNVIFCSLGFEIMGRLISEGSINDSILFTLEDSTNMTALGFFDLDITEQDSSFISYTKFEYLGAYFNNSSKARIDKCIINKSRLYFYNSSPIIKNAKIKNNSSPDTYGGGIYCTENSSPYLYNVVVKNNEAEGAGGVYCTHNSNPVFENSIISNNNPDGIYCNNSSSPNFINVLISDNEGWGVACANNSNPILDSVIIRNNTNYGGLYCVHSSPVLSDVTISGNSHNEGEYGGGIVAYWSENLIMENVKITGNSSIGLGGGIALIESNITMVNGLVVNNDSDDAGGIYGRTGSSLNLTNVTVSDNSINNNGIVGGIGCEFNCILNLTNCIVYDNDGLEVFLYGYGCESDITYSDVEGGWQGVGNINTDPLFADTLYHLSGDSPCIDAGNPDTMYYDPEDPNNPGYALYPAMGSVINDMGFYGGHGNYEPINAIGDEPSIPGSKIVISNSPNPFIKSTIISFSINRNREKTTIDIYNIKGQKIKTLLNNELIEGGKHEITWDGKNSKNKPVGSGVYFIKLRTEKDVNVKKMIKLER